MEYEGLIIRPPSEANSLIIQATVGCSHNKCTFCPAYKKKKFRIKSSDEILNDIQSIEPIQTAGVRRVFLCDGDPLILNPQILCTVLENLSGKFPRIQRVGIYANAESILKKSIEDLQILKKRKLGIVYMGLESGDDVTLQKVKKGATSGEMVEAAAKIKEAGMKLNVTVLLGLGGHERSTIHAKKTIDVLNKMKPNHVAALTLMLVPGTPLYTAYEKNKFSLPDKFTLLEELKIMIELSDLQNTLFFSNHASNYFPIQARLSKDKESILSKLESVLSSRDERSLRAEHMRGL